jgi:DNA polymerase V|tara:strand:+ start:4242 stop:4667 length:426 start_codon:yes stop_codon:yes gene_type:complete
MKHSGSPDIFLKKYLNLYSTKISAGFPSPADDYVEAKLDLNEHLVKTPSATFFAKAEGDSMVDRGIFDGDLLIVDRSVEAKHGNIIVAAINGGLTCKLLDKKSKRLIPANKLYRPIVISEDTDFSVEGVVTYSIRKHKCLR